MPPEIRDKLISGLATAAAGVVLGWLGQSLALGSRVGSLEAGQTRIEQRLDTLIGAQAGKK